jgi:hypothetical protein
MKRVLVGLMAGAVYISICIMIMPPAEANSDSKQQKKLIKKIRRSSPVQINSDNSFGSPLYIQEATVKQISAEEFTLLVGETPRHVIQTTFPDVVLLNSSPKVIKAFAVVVKSAIDKPKSGYVLFKDNVSIPSNSSYTLRSNEWPRAERVSIQEGSRFVNVMRKPGLNSAKSWLRGAGSDLKITVGYVEFDDSTRWTIASNTDW